MKTKYFVALVLIVLTGLFVSTNVWASEADFFKGKTITFVCPHPPGGGYDRIVRSLAVTFQEMLGARVIAKNIPAAVGIRAANMVYKAKPDGLTIALLPGTALILGVIGKLEGVAYDFPKYSFIGRVTAEPKVLFTKPKGKINNLDDMMNSSQPATFGFQGSSDDAFVFMAGIKYAMNMPIKFVVGYRGTSAIELAVMSGEVDAGFGAVGSRYPKIHAGDLQGIALLGTENPPEPEYRNLPVLPGKYKYVPGGKEVMQAILDINGAHRVVAGPRGMSEKRRQFLEDTLYKALNDPKLKKQWKKEGRVAKFLSGKDYAKLAQGIFGKLPQALLDAWQTEKKKIKY